jgi:hypothetical protein
MGVPIIACPGARGAREEREAWALPVTLPLYQCLISDVDLRYSAVIRVFVDVRMVLLHQVVIGFYNLLAGGVVGDTEDFVGSAFTLVRWGVWWRLLSVLFGLLVGIA